MKKWMYLISVGGMLAVFLFFYLSHMKQVEIQAKINVERAAQQRKAEADRKAVIEQKAREDAEHRAKERADADAKKEADRLARWQEENRKIQDSTNDYNAKADAFSKQVSQLDVELNALRQQKEKLSRETFDLQKQVEQGHMAQRAAEMENQRMTDMIAKRAADSALTRAPAPQPTKS